MLLLVVSVCAFQESGGRVSAVRLTADTAPERARVASTDAKICSVGVYWSF